MPPVHVRSLRRIVAQRFQITRGIVRVQNELHSLLHRHNIVAPAGRATLFRAGQRDFWEQLAVSPTDKLQIQHCLAQMELFKQQQLDIDVEIARLTRTPEWESSARLLLQLPGFGMLTTMTILGAIGDISRFATAKKLVGYSGLGASVRSSGGKTHTGRITKSGRKDLRRSLVQSAHVAVRYHPHWQRQYDSLCRSVPKQKAIVAIARKLLVSIWHILTNGAADEHSSVERIAKCMARWYWRLPKQLKVGLSSALFMRWHLMQLGVGHTLTHIPRPNAHRPAQTLPLATAEEAIAVFGR